MKNIALAILAVGLCFYQGYLKINGLAVDPTAAWVAFFAAIATFIV